MMPIIKSQAHRDALIRRCEFNVQLLEGLLITPRNEHTRKELEESLMVQQIALAALEAEPKGYDIPIEPWVEYAYPATPVPVLKPVELPPAFSLGDSSDGYFNEYVLDATEVKEAIREAGYPIAGED